MNFCSRKKYKIIVPKDLESAVLYDLVNYYNGLKKPNNMPSIINPFSPMPDKRNKRSLLQLANRPESSLDYSKPVEKMVHS